jgi:hypothetical protein
MESGLVLGGALAFAVRADRVLAVTSATIATSAIWCAVVAVLGAAAVATARRHSVLAL